MKVSGKAFKANFNSEKTEMDVNAVDGVNICPRT